MFKAEYFPIHNSGESILFSKHWSRIYGPATYKLCPLSIMINDFKGLHFMSGEFLLFAVDDSYDYLIITSLN